MKTAISLLIVISIGSVFSLSKEPTIAEEKIDIEPFIFETMINETIFKLISALDDPIVVGPLLGLNPSGSLISGTLDLEDLQIGGISGLSVPHLKYLMNLEITLVFPKFEISSSKYLADLLLLDVLPMYGNGSADILLTGLELAVVTKVNLTSLQLHHFSITLGLETFKMDIQGLLNDEGATTFFNEIINILAEYLIIPFLNGNAETVSAAISPIVEDLLNSILAGLSGDNTTPNPGTTVAPTTTDAPTTIGAPGTTVAPATTDAPASTGAPGTTVAPATTGAPATIVATLAAYVAHILSVLLSILPRNQILQE